QVGRWPQADCRTEGNLPGGDDRLGTAEPARGPAHRLHGLPGMRLQEQEQGAHRHQPVRSCFRDPSLMLELGRGALSKMSVQLGEPAQYSFRLNEEQVPVNPLIGKTLRLEYLGAINCTHCGRKTNKSFSQGYCYPCFKKLPQCDICIMSPEKCHHDFGTCRDPQWGMDFCMTDHVVYLANSSGIKVGITRATQLPTRWLDQGASQALPIMRVATRQQSGMVEDLLRSQVADRTNWRALLKGDAEAMDLVQTRE